MAVSKKIGEEEEVGVIARRGRHRRRGPTNARPPIRKPKKTKIKSKKIELLKPKEFNVKSFCYHFKFTEYKGIEMLGDIEMDKYLEPEICYDDRVTLVL